MADDSPQPDTQSAFRGSSLYRWRGWHSLVGGALFAALGWMLVAGALAHGDQDALAGARPAELVSVLDNLATENHRLEEEGSRLSGELATLTSGAATEAIAQAEERLADLQILAGTTAVRGPGVRIVVRDPHGGLTAQDILGAVQELRDAGAESIEVAQRRVVVDTWFANGPEEQGSPILISGDPRGSPYVFLAIGDPQTLATAMEIPGGVADTVRAAGATLSVERRTSLDITSTVGLTVPQYAEPVDGS